MTAAPSDALLQALAVTCALIGSEPSEASARAIANELASYPEDLVLDALRRCSMECKYRLSLADVIERIDDGRPGPDEAWELVPKDEATTAVLTQEIMEAIPFDLLGAGDLIAARMAFREAYRANVSRARANKIEPRWTPSLGTDQTTREGPLLEAVRLGRLPAAQAQAPLPHLEGAADNVRQLIEQWGKDD